MPLYPTPVAWLWSGGIVTVEPVAPPPPGGRTGTITVGPITVTDPTTGTTVTTAGSVDVSGGGSFTITVNPADGSASTTVNAPTTGGGGGGGYGGRSDGPDTVEAYKIMRDTSQRVIPVIPPPRVCRPACPER